ncbi:hypothetical protein TPHA_0A01750 [Tetrapisispora phaffii CBS 4417]|uniref:Major facilitator superfamily (MFS) profile domain-containing protein n=1 Tax=Tetrapisispora phaffii (strain ATCC 24235 / CBS 4417 / NBRC 1672 / NRRL Y-8282 / UCD 70-5) TaxID=1071381 RepID=G8BMY0_TETPH|nr:hypothetical protein TPHA_0A01750 [Tetrapisispora phaffii CBS 4417]CCE61258.1 hypothetical protein TPHA_0A01750 [Tetrapisispora phaffii CBS 4417]
MVENDVISNIGDDSLSHVPPRVQEDKSPLLHAIRGELLQDSSFSLPGFVAAEIEEREELYREASIASNQHHDYGSVANSIILDNDKNNLSPTRLRLAMSSMYLGIFLSALDNTIVSTLLARIGSEFNELPRISWIATAYLLSSATFQPLYGKISDIFGRKIVLTFCNVNFFIGCLICGTAKSFWVLVIGRFISGVGGGGITSMSTITVSDIIPLRNRALYQGVCNFYYGLGIALGGIIGGWFTEKLGSWRGAFLFQVPLSVISTVTVMVWLQLPKDSKSYGLEITMSNNSSNNGTESIIMKKLKTIDWYGAMSLVIFLLSFMILSSAGGSDISVKSNTFLYLTLISVTSFISFIYIELKFAKDPILPLVFLKDRSVLGSSLSNWFTMMLLMTISYYLPIYFTSVMGIGAYDVGKRTLPNFFSVAFGSLGAGYYMKKTGKYYWFVTFFCLVVVIGCLQIYLINDGISVWRQYLLSFVPGLGAAVLITIALLSMIVAVPHEYQAVTTSISYAFRSTGCTLGVSIGAALFRDSLNKYLRAKILELGSQNGNYSEKELLQIIDHASKSIDWVHNEAPRFFKRTILECYHYACKKVFLFCLICSVLALLSISMIKEHKLHSSLDRKEDDTPGSEEIQDSMN